MSIREVAKQEERTLAKYVKAKLRCSLKAFCDSEGVPVSTMQDRWRSDDGRARVIDMVFRFYVDRFSEL